jgi:hypothetical protein
VNAPDKAEMIYVAAIAISMLVIATPIIIIFVIALVKTLINH